MAIILVVDDEEPVVDLLTDILEDQGYTVRVAHHGKDALQSMQDELPDLIISDIMMPYMDGLELCRRIRAGADTQGVPIILMSAAKSPVLDECGANAFIGKPFTIDHIDDLVAFYLGAAASRCG